MAIVLDDSTGSGGNTGTPITVAHTTAASSNMLMVVYINSYDGLSSSDRNVSGITYNGDALTKAADFDSGTQNNNSELWFLLNPDSGTHDVVVTMGGTTENTDVHIATFSGVRQTSQPDAANATEDIADDPVGASVTTVADNCLVVSGVGIENDGNASPVAPQTQLENTSTGYNVSSYTIQTPAGAETHNYTNGLTASTTIAMASFAPFVSATTSIGYKSLLGVGL